MAFLLHLLLEIHLGSGKGDDPVELIFNSFIKKEVFLLNPNLYYGLNSTKNHLDV
jgi:hypothetical protein